MEVKQESILVGYPSYISLESNEKINEQMRNGIAKVKFGKNVGTALISKIPFPTKYNMLPVLMLSNHVYNPEVSNKEVIEIQIKSAFKNIKIDLTNRKYYTNKDYDITIIELKEKDNINYFLELDDIIIDDIINNEDKTFQYKDETVYAIHYPGGKLSVSHGVISDIYSEQKYNFNHLCCTSEGSSGCGIFNINNKLIGIHIGGMNGKNNNFNIGTFLNFPIKEFLRKYFPNFQNKIIKENSFNKNHIIENNNKNNWEKFFLDLIKEKKDRNLNLTEKNIGNEGLEYLTKLNLEKFRILLLDSNNLNNIEALGKIKCDKLENLNLKNNCISDIGILEKVNYINLVNLDLNSNNISNISILDKVNFPKLKELNLSNNKITNIKVLENVKFPCLEELDLNHNEISDIQILSKVNLQSLDTLNLSENKISDITVLEIFNFNNLKNLFLSQNDISDCKVLTKIQLKGKLRINLQKNKISDITTLDGISDNLNLILIDNPIDNKKYEALISNLIKEKKIRF